jgi:hypothetical protein
VEDCSQRTAMRCRRGAIFAIHPENRRHQPHACMRARVGDAVIADLKHLARPLPPKNSKGHGDGDPAWPRGDGPAGSPVEGHREPDRQLNARPTGTADIGCRIARWVGAPLNRLSITFAATSLSFERPQVTSEPIYRWCLRQSDAITLLVGYRRTSVELSEQTRTPQSNSSAIACRCATIAPSTGPLYAR